MGLGRSRILSMELKFIENRRYVVAALGASFSECMLAAATIIDAELLQYKNRVWHLENNVANLCLARSTERRREFAIRAALGGGARRLFLQLITESLVLGLLGGAAGFLLGEWTRHVMLALGAAYIPRAQEIRLDAWVMLFALAASCLTAILFGVLPAGLPMTTSPLECGARPRRSSAHLRTA